MPKYLFQASYSPAGSAGVAKDGGTKRRAAAEELINSLGGSIDCMYFAFGDVDVFAVIDLPDNASAAAASLTTASSGAISGKLTVLLTPEEIDQASQKAVAYTPPGQ